MIPLTLSLLAIFTAGAIAYTLTISAARREKYREAVEHWQNAYADKLTRSGDIARAKIARDDFRAQELKAEIARLKARKKKHGHLVAELKAITERRLLWERGA